MAELKQYKVGDTVQFPITRPSHWNKKGAMDCYLGTKAVLTGVHNMGLGIQRLYFEGSKLWMFLNTDVCYGYQSNDYKAIANYRPYELPYEDVKKAMEPYIPPKPWEPEVGKPAVLVMPVSVLRNFGNGWLDVHDNDGNCLKVSRKTLLSYNIENNKENSMKAMKDAVLTVTKSLLKANNTVTTLEVKTELRRDYPYYFWTQNAVSTYMSQLAGDGVLTYTDNGTYRIYSLANATPSKSISTAKTVIINTTPAGRRSPKRKALNQANALNMLISSMGAGFERAEFKNGRTITLNEIKAQKKSALGYLRPKFHNVSKITVKGTTYNVI